MRYLSKHTLAGLAVSVMTIASGASQATCVPSEPNGWELPITLTTLSTGGGVTYFSALLYTSATKAQWSGTGQQLISSHTTCLGSSCIEQPFAANSPEQLAVTIKTNQSVTITLLSHGNAKVTFTAKCDPLTHVLYGDGSFFSLDDTFVSFDFGTPFKVPT